ncbi:MAG: 50S ribosomal protein L15 [Bacteroidetes bacterium]|nr:50S ribosomal protein L15 [Bacteroidota bacterium]
MELHKLESPAPNKKTRKRVGRGEGSGLGKQSGKGHNGQKARGSGKVAVGFEGGQMPLYRRIPKYGFKNFNRVAYVSLNLYQLAQAMDQKKVGTKITFDDLVKARLVDQNDKVKLLAHGDFDKKISIEVHKASATAKAKIEELGGTIVSLTKEEAPAPAPVPAKAKAKAKAETTEAPEAQAPEVVEEETKKEVAEAAPAEAPEAQAPEASSDDADASAPTTDEESKDS